MPKSRHRKNHKKKLAAWKNKVEIKNNHMKKKMIEMQEKLTKEMQEKQEKEENKNKPMSINVDPKTL